VAYFIALARNYDYLYKTGVAEIFGPGTNIPDAAAKVLALVEKKRKAA
jgi:methylmalonyl-CoA mutase cobalamin-binding domain/chain